MASDCAAVGSFSRFAVDAVDATFGAASERYSILYEDLGSHRVLQGFSGITGTRSRWAGRVRNKSYLVQGKVALNPSPNDLSKWLPRIFGGPLSAGAVTLADVLPAFDVLVDRENGVFRYRGMQVAQAVIRGQTANGGDSEDVIEMILVLIGLSEKTPDDASPPTWAGAIPELGEAAADTPYVFFESSLTVPTAGTNIPGDQFALVVNNHLMVRFRNSVSPVCIRATDRSIQVSAQIPFTTAYHTLMYNMNTVASTGVFKLLSTGGAFNTTFTFPALRNVYVTPAVAGKVEVPMKIMLEAGRTVSLAEVAIAHDATP